MVHNTIFSHILKDLPSKTAIQDVVTQHKTDRYVKSFTTYDHLITMIYLQLGCSDSLRDIEAVAESSDILCNNMRVRRSTLHDANKRRDPEVFIEILRTLMQNLPNKLNTDIIPVIKILDSTPIQIRGRGSEWTQPHSIHQCQGLKVHLGLSLENKAPWLCKITDANITDITVAKEFMPIEKNNYYIFDKGYCDYNWWHKMHINNAYFVTRIKKNAVFKILKSNETPINSRILKDDIINLCNKSPRANKVNLLFNTHLRRITIQHPNNKPGATLIIITNALHLTSEEISYLYKKRWEIELLFKFIKQNLRFKKFIGENRNAIIIQLITALIAYILILLLKIKIPNIIPLNKVLLLIKQFLVNNITASSSIFQRLLL